MPKDETYQATDALQIQDFAALPVLKFMSEMHDALWHAARLLGGYETSRLVDKCADAFERERRMTRTTRMMLDQILAVLTLENVHELEMPYMGFFAAIDPNDPVVEEICLLSDGLSAAIEDYEERLAWSQSRQTVA